MSRRKTLVSRMYLKTLPTLLFLLTGRNISPEVSQGEQYGKGGTGERLAMNASHTVPHMLKRFLETSEESGMAQQL